MLQKIALTIFFLFFLPCCKIAKPQPAPYLQKSGLKKSEVEQPCLSLAGSSQRMPASVDGATLSLSMQEPSKFGLISGYTHAAIELKSDDNVDYYEITCKNLNKSDSAFIYNAYSDYIPLYCKDGNSGNYSFEIRACAEAYVLINPVTSCGASTKFLVTLKPEREIIEIYELEKSINDEVASAYSIIEAANTKGLILAGDESGLVKYAMTAIQEMGLSEYTRKIWLQWDEQKKSNDLSASQGLALASSDYFDKATGCLDPNMLRQKVLIPVYTPPPVKKDDLEQPTSPTQSSPANQDAGSVSEKPASSSGFTSRGAILLGIGLGLGISLAGYGVAQTKAGQAATAKMASFAQSSDLFLSKMTRFAFFARNKAIILVYELSKEGLLEERKAFLQAKLREIDEETRNKAQDFLEVQSKNNAEFAKILKDVKSVPVSEAPPKGFSQSLRDITNGLYNKAAKNPISTLGVATVSLAGIILLAINNSKSKQSLIASELDDFIDKLEKIEKSISEKMNLFYKKMDSNFGF